MRILITGGTGFLGSHWLASRPHDDITLLTRQLSPSLAHPQVRLIHSLAELDNANEFDVVMNLAGEAIVGKRWSEAQKQRIWHSRVTLTRQLVSLINRSDTPPRLLLSGSAIGIYGATEGPGVTESSDFRRCEDDFAQQLCLAWESEAEQVSGATRCVCLRTGIVLSSAGGALAQMLPAFRFGLGARLGDGSQQMSWIHLHDWIGAVNAIIADCAFRGAVNLVAPNPVSNSQFTRELVHSLRRPALFKAPGWILKLLLGEASQLLLDSQRVLPETLLLRQFQFQHPELAGALRQLL